MLFAHLSDLHLGKRLCEAPLLEDQRHILAQVLALLDAHKPNAVLLAGDLYDKPVPPTEAVQLLDWFLTQLAARGLPVLAVSGNHDSAQRVGFGAQLLAHSGVYLSPVLTGPPAPVSLRDEYGPVEVYLLPFVKPAAVRPLYPEEEIDGYAGALAALLRRLPPKTGRRVLVAHQFVAGAAACDSEEAAVGGVDAVDASLFDGFDYVALGHLHSPQAVGRAGVRYCGSPLKYSFSEAAQQKSLTLVRLGPAGELELTLEPLHPLHELRQLRGSYEQLTRRENYRGTNMEDYLHITLTDEQDIPDGMARLRTIYPNLLRLDYDNRRTRAARLDPAAPRAAQPTPLQAFTAFYEGQNGQPMSAEQAALCQSLIEDVWKEAEA